MLDRAGIDRAVIDRAGLAEFLRRRREALQPEDVGLPRGRRRRTRGLRREEVAALCHMSIDYCARLERERGPRPSEQMIAAIAQGLHLDLDERDHLFRLAGHHPPARGALSEHVSSGLLRIFDRLVDTPAEIVTELGETLRQTPMGVALTGDATGYTGPARSLGCRWFTDPGARDAERAGGPCVSLAPVRLAPAHARHPARARLPGGAAGRAGPGGSEELRNLWDAHEVGVRPAEVKRFVHPQVGMLELNCQMLLDPQQSHLLLVYSAVPGTESYEKLHLLSVLGAQEIG